NLAQRGVRLLGGHGLDLEAHATLLWAGFQILDLIDSREAPAGLLNELVDRRHIFFAKPCSGTTLREGEYKAPPEKSQVRRDLWTKNARLGFFPMAGATGSLIDFAAGLLRADLPAVLCLGGPMFSRSMVFRPAAFLLSLTFGLGGFASLARAQ